MQIGRITGLAEPRDFSQPDQSTVAFSVLASPTQARQLLGHGDNGAERFVPIDFGSWGGEHDGIYELLDVSVDADPNLDAASLRQVQVTARAQNRGRQVANSVLLVRGDNRNRVANVGVRGPLYRASISSAASAVASFNAGPAGFTVGSAVPTLGRGSVVRLTDRSQVKEAVRVATTPTGGNINLATGTLLTIDGVTLAAGNRVLVKNQTNKAQNGIYVAGTGGWSRASDANDTTELDYASVFVTNGTVNGGTTWFNPNVITIGTTTYDWQQSPAWGLRQSARGGPVSVTYGLGLANWYDGACTITQGGAVVTGSTLAASGTVTMDNGLIRLEYLDLSMATGSPLAWGVARNVRADGLIAPTYSSASVLLNTPDVVTVRYRASEGVQTSLIDFSMVRGSRTLTVAVTYNLPEYGYVNLDTSTAGAFDISTAPTASTGIGYTSAADHLVYAGADDSDGNRWGLSYAGLINDAIGPGLLYASATRKQTHVFGVHAVVGGGTTLTGDDQLYGMDRAWFAMLAQQTSAGVL